MGRLHLVREARCFPDFVQGYLEFTNELEAPEIFHIATALWTLSSVLRRRVWLDQGHFLYCPNQYFVLVAPPGVVAKSTTISVGAKLLRDLPEITFGPDSSTWQAFFEKLVQAQREEVLGPTDDLNSPRQISAAITLAISEFGSFLNMDEDQLVNLLINFWDGQTGSFNRTTRLDGSIDIINPLVNLIGCTTDAWMQENFKAHLLEGGLGSRILFVHANQKRKLVPYPHLVHNPERHAALRKRLIDDLQTISLLYGNMTLDPEAISFGEAFYARHHAEDNRGAYFDGYHTRKFAHMHKLAMVFSVSQSNDLVIRRTHLEQALHFLGLLEEGIAATTATVRAGASPQGQRILHVRTVVKAAGTLSMRALTHRLIDKLSTRELDAVVNDLVRAGQIEILRAAAGRVSLKWIGD